MYKDADYGGMYIDDEGNLNVYVLPKNEKLKNQIIKTADSKAVINVARYSLQELKDGADYAWDFFAKHNVSANSIAIDESINRVKIEVNNSINSQITEEFSSEDLYVLTYSDQETEIIDEVNVGPGYSIYDSGGSYSLAFMAKDNSGQVGFVTAGHCIEQVGVSVYSKATNTKIGEGTSNKFDSGNADVAFIKRTNSNYVPTRYAAVTNHEINAASASYLIQGAAVSLVGNTTGHSVGNITSTYGSVGSAFGRVLTNYSSSVGDSGGVMYVGRFLEGSSSIYMRSIVGVHNGSYYSGTVRRGAYGTRIDTALSKLNISYLSA